MFRFSAKCLPLIVFPAVFEMADALSRYTIDKYKLELTTNDCPLSYVRRQATKNLEFAFCVEIPWPLLRIWNEFVESPTSNEDEDGINYIDLLNNSVTDHWFAVKDDCVRINERLRLTSTKVKLAYRQTTGRKRQSLDKKTSKICTYKERRD